MKRKKLTLNGGRLIEALLIIILIIVIVAVIISSLPHRLDYSEVRDYKGQKLSSIKDFIDNSIKGPQYVNSSNYTLTIDGLVKKDLNYTYNKVLSHTHYEKVIRLYCVEGWDATILWEGVLLKDLFDEAGLDQNANTVLFYAYDGYSSSLPLDYVINNNILLAYKMNGVTLPAERGFPFQVVAESKLGYKWVKWITRIELSNDTNYKGYWESRGYSNEANPR